MLHIMFGLIGQAVSEKMMFEYYDHMYTKPRGGGRQPPEDIFSIMHTPSKFPPFNYILLIFPIQMHGQPTLALP